MKRGLLLVNLGTPEAPRSAEVRRYLREFLSDPRVIDINPVGRFLLVNLIIAPFRAPKSAEAYRKIWFEAGSPLLVHGRALAEKVQAALGGDFEVELAMRYGAPSIADALERLRARGVGELVLFPLYPQYAASSYGSTLERVYSELGLKWDVLPVAAVPPFYADAGFLDSFAEVGRAPVASADHVLFSFHGLPERQIHRSDPTGQHCLASASCCDRIGEANRFCYRAQCFATARGIAQRLGLAADRYTVSFQSRLGRTPWIRPHSDVVAPELARKGVKRLAVFCPAFVADCLETLEEVGLRLNASFVEAGGESLTLVPSLNATPLWVETVARLARATAG